MAKHRAPRPPRTRWVTIAAVAAAALAFVVGVPTVAPATVTSADVTRSRPQRVAQLPPVTLPYVALDMVSASWFLTPLPAGAVPTTTVTRRSTVAVRSASAQAAAPTAKAVGTTGGLAARVVAAALAQRGTPYVYGGASPGGFDCSGLVQYAYRSAGIALPRTAAAQAGVGRSVPLSDVHAGDLIYYYSPVTHVVISAGNGMVIEASQPGTPVRLRPLYTQGLAGARRVIG